LVFLQSINAAFYVVIHCIVAYPVSQLNRDNLFDVINCVEGPT